MEEPDGDVDCEAQGAGVGCVVGGGEGEEGGSVPGADFFEYAMRSALVFVLSGWDDGRSEVYPWMPIATEC